MLPKPSLLVPLQSSRLLQLLARLCHGKAPDKPAPKKSDLEVCTIAECMVDPCKPEPAVVIIGAGIAGLSAAQRLAQCGLTNFTVLEATDRPGGRIHSCWLGDVIAEMGAQFIEGGCIGNPVYNLAAQEGLLKPPLQRAKPLSGIFCTSDGRAIDQPVAVLAFQTFKQIENEAASLFSMGGAKQHGSLLNFLSLRIQQELQNFPDEQKYDVARIMYGMTNAVRTKCGEDLSQVSADNYGSFIQIPGGQIRIPLGFIGVLSPLMRELPENALRLNKPVGNIRWGAVQARNKGGPRAVVQCCDGQEFPADYVILTVSLGVLKEHADKMFCPALPSSKMDAINNIGYGNVDKIFLDYDRPFWVWCEGGINFAWSPDELANRTDWTKGLSAIEEVHGSKHVLCAYISGPEAAIMEHASDEEVAEGITRILRQFTGDASLPYPSTVLRSKWATDPFFCGSYSYMGLNSHVGHQCDLSCPVPGTCEPIPPILLFAGEATCAGHHSTVHGARLSGIREAERVIQLTKSYGGPPPSI
ncbi:spermine oxidase-like isoform X1 [Tribolium madens]|uniref:spermine oxidase-like isoform X1 n=1 Tax=Tribolium madens TaxID=41895 RepID=UPI001CF71DB3|nr:spermine oxidase-like isoform X1 [Tribolium madens]